MSKPPAKKAAGRKKNGYAMPKKLPVGTVLKDTAKVEWISGPSIGVGGFGEIYSACRADSKQKNSKDYPCVIKIEPHGNGPLFVEMHFYMRNAKAEDIETFKKSHKLKHLGMPHFIGSGSHELEGEKHRFVILPRYGTDIWSLYLKNGRKFPENTVYRLAVQMIDVLEYIHGCTYVHADIKGANMLLGFGKGGDSQVVLVDFGLASHYTTSPEYKPDPKKMHNGTIEYTSRDAHNGVPTMRGDMEILAFNLIHWYGGSLPWEKQLIDPVKVQAAKNEAMNDLSKFMKLCFPKGPPAPIVNFIKYVSNLQYRDQPDYNKCRKLFPCKDTGPLEFSAPKAVSKKRASSRPVIDGSDDEVISTKRTRSSTASRPIEIEDSPEPVPVKKSRKREAEKPEPSTPSKKVEKSAIIHLETPSKAKKVYQFNIDLDVSIDADVLVKVNRKPKKTDAPVLDATVEEDEEQENASFVAETKKTKKTTVKETAAQRREKLNIPKTVTRAGEYKGKKAKD